MLNIISKRLKNGAFCCLIPKRGYNEKEIMIAFRYGSKDISFNAEGKEVNQPYGIAHFLEHKMFEDKDLNIFDGFSKLGLSANAYTNFDTTAYYFTGCDNIEKGFNLLMKMVSELYLTEESIKKEKGIITQEINMYKDDPYWQIYFDTLKALYTKNPIRESVAGDVSDIEKITKDMLFESYDSFYTYENCVIIGCGDIDCNEFFAQAENLKLKSRNVVRSKYNDEIYKSSVEEKLSVGKGMYHIGFRHNHDMPIVDRICTANVILHTLLSKSSSLFNRLYAMGIADSGTGYEVIEGLDYSAGIIKSEGNKDAKEKVVFELLKEINHISALGIDKKDIERTVSAIKTKMLFDSENISSIVSFCADCFTKNTEILDIYNNYDKINIDMIMTALKDYKEDNMVTVFADNSI